VVANLNIGWDQTRIAVVRFSNVADIRIQLNQYNSSADIVSVINNITFIGSTTNTSDALSLTRTQVCLSIPVLGK